MEAQELVMGLLDYEPDQRLTAQQVLASPLPAAGQSHTQALAHLLCPWLTCDVSISRLWSSLPAEQMLTAVRHMMKLDNKPP